MDNGQIAVVWLIEEEETTLERVYLAREVVRLVPANPAYKARAVPAGNVEIQGRLLLVLRGLAEA